MGRQASCRLGCSSLWHPLLLLRFFNISNTRSPSRLQAVREYLRPLKVKSFQFQKFWTSEFCFLKFWYESLVLGKDLLRNGSTIWLGQDKTRQDTVRENSDRTRIRWRREIDLKLRGLYKRLTSAWAGFAYRLST